MNTAVYGQRRLPMQYDGQHTLVYLNEVAVDDYNPSEEEGAQPRNGFAYTGTMDDGGTLVDCTDATDRDLLINGIIRHSYNQAQEDAIKTHQLQVLKGDELTADKVDAYNAEWEAFNTLRANTIALVDLWLN